MARFLRPVLLICQIIFALFLVYFAIRLARYHLGLVAFPFPSGLREGAMMTSTDDLVKGLNPYAMALQPQHTNQYGIIYPLLVWPWAKIFGTTIFIHRMVSAFFILASCVLIFFVLRKMAVPILLNIWAVLMLYSSLIFPGTSTPTIDAGSTGTFFFLLTVFVPWFCQYSYKSLIGSVLLGTLAFYTKPYAFLGALVMLSYLFFFVSKMKSFFYGFLLMILSVISMMAANQIFPAYFDNSFFISANQAPAWSSAERLREQIVSYGTLHQWTFILMGLFILGYGFSSLRSLFSRVRPSPIDGPIRDFDAIKLVLYAGACSAFVLFIFLGRHTGSTLWYFFQLLSPFLLVSAAWLFSWNVFWPILCVPLLIYNLHIMTADQNYKWFDKNMLGWPEISLLVSQHQHILNSPLIAPLLVEQNKEVFDNGQTEYFLSGGKRDYWMKNLFKEDERVFVQQLLFFYNIKNMVDNKEFDLIILQPSLLPLVGDDIRKYYKFEGHLIVYAPQDRRPYEITVWRPL